MTSEGKLALVSLKSFGDLVIARWAIRQLAASACKDDASLVIGSHLAELDQALGPRSAGTFVVAHGEGGVPAVFDARKRGLVRALLSGLQLRNAIAQLPLPVDTTLVFDRVGPRENLLAAGRPLISVAASSNIYLAYEKSLGILSGALQSPCPDTTINARASYVGIFPGSRISAKRLPQDVINEAVDLCAGTNVPCKVFVLEGEPADIARTRAEVVQVPRKFSAMTALVRQAGVVISADSLPAHLAEYYGLPVFVVSPVPNCYWLPKSCFRQSQWSLFSEVASASGALHRFMQRFV